MKIHFHANHSVYITTPSEPMMQFCYRLGMQAFQRLLRMVMNQSVIVIGEVGMTGYQPNIYAC